MQMFDTYTHLKATKKKKTFQLKRMAEKFGILFEKRGGGRKERFYRPLRRTASVGGTGEASK